MLFFTKRNQRNNMFWKKKKIEKNIWTTGYKTAARSCTEHELCSNYMRSKGFSPQTFVRVVSDPALKCFVSSNHITIWSFTYFEAFGCQSILKHSDIWCSKYSTRPAKMESATPFFQYIHHCLLEHSVLFSCFLERKFCSQCNVVLSVTILNSENTLSNL